jgi:hypothetical protein
MYSQDQAKIWEDKFMEFNYKIRRLTAEYGDVLADPRSKPGESD